jgi:hypothetical protein
LRVEREISRIKAAEANGKGRSGVGEAEGIKVKISKNKLDRDLEG